MNKPEKLILTIKRTQVFAVEVSAEEGYDAFPDTLLEMVDYVNGIKNDPFIYIDDEPVPVEDNTELLNIEEK